MEHFKKKFIFNTEDPRMKGFHEAIFSVTDIDKWVDFFQRVCHWKVISRNEGTAELKRNWHLDTVVEIEEVLLQSQGDQTGFLRLVQFENVEKKQIRSGTSIWDSGGIFDVNMRAKNLEQLYRAFQDEGWNGYTDPKRFVFGKFDVSEVLVKGPDGITFALMQRFAPPLEGYPDFEVTSRIFNSTTICQDIDTTMEFFINKLGFEIYFETSGTERSAGPNVIGIPPNINDTIEVPVSIIHPSGKNYGSIELLETKQLKGRNCADLAKPPNLGILMLRFPVADAEAYAEKIQANGVQLNSKIQTLHISPYGEMKIFSVRTPDGVWLEFMELIRVFS